MSHDKIRAAARERKAATGEPYTAARRAAVTEHQGEIPSQGTGYALRMSGEIHDWLADLRGSDPAAAKVVVQALAALLTQGARLGEPLVVSTADSWPWALFDALDRSYQERVERLHVVRRGEADADMLIKDIRKHTAELELAQANQQAAESRRLLPGVIEARRRLGNEERQLQGTVDALRARKEVLKATYMAAYSSLAVNESIAAGGLTGDDRDAEARMLRDVTAQMEREVGQQARPEGLMELRPAGPGEVGIRILFAVEPPGDALLIAVLDGPEPVRNQRLEAILASSDVLRRVRAGQAPEAAAHRYDNTRSFVAEFYPGDAGDASRAGG